MGVACTQHEMERRLVRYGDLRSCTTAFIDTRTPGSERKENFTIIGPGVAENPDQHVHIEIPHGFNIGGARQPPHCVNSQHAHETAEVFMVHSGRWAFRWGKDATDGEVILTEGDTISIPVQVFRGFENIGEDTGHLFAILGGDDPGRVVWAPRVFELATEYGLVLLENGQLVDTTRGETVPEGISSQAPTTEAEADGFRRMSEEEMLQCVIRASDFAAPREGGLNSVDGVEECPIIGAASSEEALPAGRMNWPHGFHFRRLRLRRGAEIPSHSRSSPEVFFLHSGRLRFEWGERCSVTLSKGDVLTLPNGLQRRWANASEEEALAYVVRGGDQPPPAIWAGADGG